MAGVSQTPCHFDKLGSCRNGVSCAFLHIGDSALRNRHGHGNLAISAVESLSINTPVSQHRDGKLVPTQTCTFFIRGSCTKGDQCRFVHPPAEATANHFDPNAKSFDPTHSQSGEHTNQMQLDSRSRIPCKYSSSSGGCRNVPCPYLHSNPENVVNDELRADEVEDEEPMDFTRIINGASAYFSEHGQITKISLPTDFSIASVIGFPTGSTPGEIVEILRKLDVDLDINCVSVWHAGTKATLKVEDPLFADKLCASLGVHQSKLSAVPVPIASKRSNFNKVYISWHRSSRSVWLNFGSGDIAKRVAQKFNAGVYRCLGQALKSSEAKCSSIGWGRGGGIRNPVAWSITLADVPGDATEKDIAAAITASFDTPRHIEMGKVNYHASPAETSVDIRLSLEKYGPLERFSLAPTSKGKRVKAVAWFEDDADARSACSLNNQRLEALGNGKLSVAVVQSVKIKVSTNIYSAVMGRIDAESTAWRAQHLTFHVYADTSRRFTTLKIEGENTKDVTNARKSLDAIISGTVIKDGDEVVWDGALVSNGSAYRGLKSIENLLQVVIIRDKLRRQLLYYGSLEKSTRVLRELLDMLNEESKKTHAINLDPIQFSWALKGGFKVIDQVLGNKVATFNIVSKQIIITGTPQQYKTASGLLESKPPPEIIATAIDDPQTDEDCPICFCNADNPIHASCKHTYCLSCFEEYCKSAASTGKDAFQIKCQGDEGSCPVVFPLSELREHLSSLVFEAVLESSFEAYIQRHPHEFRYCPTPDCGHIYRSATVQSPPERSSSHTCLNCLETICTSCHARHGSYTCAQYKDIASGGLEALAALKKELNFKDCPKCTTPMDKTEGCNHVVCPGCKAHICWACLAVFDQSGACYDHMSKVHGGIGLAGGLYRWD